MQVAAQLAALKTEGSLQLLQLLVVSPKSLPRREVRNFIDAFE